MEKEFNLITDLKINDISSMLTVLPLCGLFTAKKNENVSLQGKTIIEFNNNQFNYFVKLKGTTLTANDESVLLFLNELAIKNKSRKIKISLYEIVKNSFFNHNSQNYQKAKTALNALFIAGISTYFAIKDKNKNISRGFADHIIESYEYEDRELEKGDIIITLSEKYYQSLITAKNPVSLINRKSRATKCKSSEQKNIYTVLASWRYEKIAISTLMSIVKSKSKKFDFVEKSLKPILQIIEIDKNQKVFLKDETIVFGAKIVIENRQNSD